MTEAFIARQPIFDRDARVYAYELLFRATDGPTSAGAVNGDQATSQVLWNTFTVFGLDSLVGEARAFINFTRELLLDDNPLPLPPDRVVIEILEDVAVDADLVAAVGRLVERGYTIALDDFAYHESWQPLVDLAHVVKLDVMALGPDALRDHVARLRPLGLKMLAEKVETREELEALRDLGFDYFQGFFLARPTVVRGRRTPANRIAVLQLIARLNRPDVEVKEVEALISRDVAMSYKLLRYINSALFALPREVASIRQAVVFLGLKAIRRWASLIAMSGFDDKPTELLVIAMQRARMCQNLAEAAGLPEPESHFTVGLFSALDAVLDMPMEQVVEELPLGDDTRAALLERTGPYGPTLACTLAYEGQDWPRVTLPGLADDAIRDAYLQATAWSTAAIKELA